ncbi:chorismate mutase [Acuticoccus sp.]|uniref:chorismate mutase n=1 Tax=Acuticoccus sp. TaxID=1904378 RepID=UPI003B51DE09
MVLPSSPLPNRAPSDPLGALRERLDEVDLGLHHLMRERFEIVAKIGAVKGPSAPVIRPEREAAVIANQLALDGGTAPREVVVHLWRVLIGAACAVQRPFAVHVAGTLDSARFLYGPVSCTLNETAAGAVARLASHPDDVALVTGDEPWWETRGAAHVVASYHQSDGVTVFALGGAGVSRSTGPLALLLAHGALREVDAGAVGARDDVLGLYPPFPLTIPVAR